MADEPIVLAAPGRPRDIELAAMRAYRVAFPDGPPWLDLDVETRWLWMSEAEADFPINAGRTKEKP